MEKKLKEMGYVLQADCPSGLLYLLGTNDNAVIWVNHDSIVIENGTKAVCVKNTMTDEENALQIIKLLPMAIKDEWLCIDTMVQKINHLLYPSKHKDSNYSKGELLCDSLLYTDFDEKYLVVKTI